MKMNKESFKFNFLLIYLSATAIILILIVTAGLFISNAENVNETYTEIREPLAYNAQMITADINNHSSYLQSYLKFGNNDHRSQAESLLFRKLPQRLNTIIDLSKQLEDEKFLKMAKDLENQFKLIQDTYNQLQSSGNADEILESTYLPMLIKYGTSAKGINDYNFDNYGNELKDVFKALNNYKYLALFILLLLFLGLYIIVNRTSKKINQGIEKLKGDVTVIAEGNIPDSITTSENELNLIEQALIKLVENLKTLKLFAQDVGKGNFDTEVTVFNNEGVLGESLADMRNSLKKVSEEGKIRDWSNSGLTKFSNIIQENANDLDKLTETLVTNLTKYTKSIQGNLYLINSDENKKDTLELMACYAYDRNKYLSQTIEPGQGLVGQSFLEQKEIYLKEVPEDYVNITSGLGKANPTYIYVQPMIANEKVEGVLEVASFEPYPDHVREFLSTVCENVAASVSTARNNQNLNRIVAEANELTEELRSQEEELRQNTEELQATQEDMTRRIRELEEENEQLKQEIAGKAEDASY